MDELWKFQKEGSAFLQKYKHVILADKMGLGKSATALDAVKVIKPNRVLIVCPKNALSVWSRETEKWLGFGNFIFHYIRGTPQDRYVQWTTEILNENPIFYVCTYRVLQRDLKSKYVPYHWDLIIADEGHKARNRKTLNYKALRMLRAPYFFILTGTPATRGPQDLWGLLSLVQPQRFPSYWRFINTYCVIEQGDFGMEITGVKNAKELRNQLKTVMIRREKGDIERPPVVRERLAYKIDAEQRKLHDDMSTEMLSKLPEGGVLLSPTILSVVTRLRQIVVCPKMLDETLGYGEGIKTVVEMLSDYPQEDRHCVIFTPFTKAFPYFAEYLIENKFGPITYLKGGMEPDKVQEAVDKFVKHRGIMICSIKFAQAFELDTADKAFFIGAEWNPDDNEQAEYRLMRMLTKHSPNIYYLYDGDTFDSRVMEILNTKQRNVNRIYKDPKLLRKLLKGDQN